MSVMSMSLLLGQILGIILGIICLDKDLNGGNWRLLVLLSLLPAAASFMIQIAYMDESPRYDLLFGNQEQGLKNIGKLLLMKEKMAFVN